MKQYLVFDVNPERVQALVGSIDSSGMGLKCVNSKPVCTGSQSGMACWNVRDLHNKMKNLLQQAVEQFGKIESFGIHTWGVDYGLVSAENGELYGNPLTFANADEQDAALVHEIVPVDELFKHTGMNFLQPCTIYQLMHIQRMGWKSSTEQRLLMLPDLLAYMLTGVMKTEYTNGSVSVLYNAHRRTWDSEIIKQMYLAKEMFTEIDYPGSYRGILREEIAKELNIPQIKCVAVGSHDTASMLAGMPVPDNENWIICIPGEPTMFALPCTEAIINQHAYSMGYSNEGTIDGGYALLKNIPGITKDDDTFTTYCRQIISEYEVITKKPAKGIVLASAGSRQDALAAQISEKTGVAVVSTINRGPVAGNLMVQALAAGEFKNIDELKHFAWESADKKLY